MNRFQFNPGLIFASCLLLLAFGCHKKRPQIPPEPTTPTVIAELPIQPEPTVTEPAAPSPEEPAKPAAKPPHAPPKRAKARPAPAPKTSSEPDKPVEQAKNITPPPRVTIQEGGANAGAGQTPAGAPNDSSGSGQSTQQLLESAENNLRSIKRTLSAEEQSLQGQIRDFINQSKKAVTDGDNEGAYKLALKARLLSEQLVKNQ